MPETWTGAEVLCEALLREGVEVLFGIPGGAIMPFYDALARDPRLRHVLCRHEQGAGHAAEGYARASGRVGVCVATSGPGATNLVTPIADAWMDGTPLVAITGQVASRMLGTDAFQETDILGITAPITKHGYLVTRAEDVPHVVREAFALARSGRCGPVLIDITKDAQQAAVRPDWAAPGERPARGGCTAGPAAIEAAAALLAQADRPVVLAGHGVLWAEATGELRTLAERLSVPVITTLHGKGGFPETHALSLGMPGMHGWVHANRAIQECDVLLCVGARFDDRVTGDVQRFAPHARIIHIDIDPAEIGKLVRVDIPLVSDARAALAELAARVPARTGGEWLERVLGWKAEHDAVAAAPRVGGPELQPQDVYRAFERARRGRGRCRIVTDVGQHQMWAAQLLSWTEPRTHLTSGGAGTMGFSVPAALGAAIACPDETIWVFCGDGGFQMTNQELTTIRQEGIRNVKIGIVNNGYLGMVRQWQELFHERRYSGTPLSSPDFVKMAESYGLRGLRVETAADADAVLAEAWDHDDSVVIDLRVAPEANVFPMVRMGGSIGEMITGPEPVAAGEPATRGAALAVAAR